MKKYIGLSLFSIILLASCSKSDPAPSAVKFMSYTSGSTWNYQAVNNTPPTSTNNYTLTATNRDSTINGRAYRVFTNSSSGASEYYFNAGGDYYTYQKLPDALGGMVVENLYLKDNAAVNFSWAQSYTVNYSGINIPVTVTHKIKEKGLAKTVNSISYSDVIQVETTVAVNIPGITVTSDIQSFYAPGKGLIQNTSLVNLTALGVTNSSSTQTNLLSATIL